MTTIFVDKHTKKLLDKMKQELKEAGYSHVTYNDAIKHLYLMAKGTLEIGGKVRQVEGGKEVEANV